MKEKKVLNLDTSQDFLSRSRKFEDLELNDDDRLNLKLLQSELKTFVDGFPFSGSE
jgi:hypothetical protein